MSDSFEVPVADALLAPLLEAAGDALRAIDAAEVPLSLRHLRGFDRRGLAHGPARRQLRAAIESDEWFRARVLGRFAARSEGETVLAGWSAATALAAAEEAARRGDLPLLASALWATRPDGWVFGLGVIAAIDAGRRDQEGGRLEVRERERRVEELDEARRRADAGRMAAEIRAERLESDLREECRTGRAREEDAASEAAAVARRAEGLAAQLEQARAAVEEERAQTAREARRSHDLEGELRSARSDLAAAAAVLEERRAARPRVSPEDARALSEARDLAYRLARTLDDLAPAVGPPGGPAGFRPAGEPGARPAAVPEPAPEPRSRPALPVGLSADTRQGLEAMARTAGLVLVVDGYNVTRAAWPAVPLSDQRQRLAQGLAGLTARFGCDALVVFDGNGTVGLPALRRRGLRVIFSDAGEEADDVIVREVAALPKRIPVVVVSSDARVREHAEAEGAVVVGAPVLLALLP